MSSKLYALLAVLGLTAAFATPALAAPPVASWSSPGSGQPLTQALTLEVGSDASGVTGVGFFIDGVPIPGSVVESPANVFKLAFDPDDYANGDATLRADVTNPDGTTQISQIVAISNASAAPTWAAPVDLATLYAGPLQALTSIEYDAVEFLIDGVSLGQAVEEGFADSNDWRLAFDPSAYAPGSYVFGAVARNGSLTSVAANVTVTIPDLAAPMIGSVSPAALSAVSGTFALSLTASDNVGVTSALFSLDGEAYSAMTDLGGGSFTANVDSTQFVNGARFFYVRVLDAAEHMTDANVELSVGNPSAPVLDTTEVFTSGSLQVGYEMVAGGASATGNPTPAISYSWRVCAPGVTCNSYAGTTYTPVAGDVGRTVELVVRATNGVDPQGTVITTIGTVTAADPIYVEPAPTPTPVEPAPVAAPPVVAPPVVAPVVAPPVVTVLVNTSSAAQRVSGTTGPDRIVTGSGNDVIRAGAGNDVISPGKGKNVVYAGPGNDTVRAMQGTTLVNCGTGKDVLYANRSVRSTGCEKVVVASNNKLVQVKVGPDRRPVMPANFNGPYATVPKAPVVVAAEQKAVVATSAAAKTDGLVAVAEKKAAVAVDDVAASKAVVVAAEKRTTAAAAQVAKETAAVAAAEKALAVAKRVPADRRAILAAEQKLAAANGTLRGAQAARAVATKSLAVADTKAVVSTTRSVAAATGSRGTITAHSAAVRDVKTAATGVVTAEKTVAVAAAKTVAEKSAVVAKRTSVAKGFAAAIEAAAPAQKPAVAAKLAAADRLVAVAKKDLVAVTATAAAQDKKVAAAQAKVVVVEKTLAGVTKKGLVADDKVSLATKLAARARSAALRRTP